MAYATFSIYIMNEFLFFFRNKNLFPVGANKMIKSRVFQRTAISD
jgi:hypothetical protein